MINLNKTHSPCVKCWIRGHEYSPEDEHCQNCEFDIAIAVLKKVLKENDFCRMCKNRNNLGGGYWDCKLNDSGDYMCVENKVNFCIDWEVIFDEYDIPYTKENI